MQVSQLNNADKLTIANELRKHANGCRVFMCIGTENVTADSLGPKVGKLINEQMSTPIFVYGLDTMNITAQNLIECYKFIKSMHQNEKIVVIDAGVGEDNQIGQVQIIEHGIVPGAATNKNLPMVGDTSIVGIVANKDLKDFYSSSQSKEDLVNRLASFICDTIILASTEYNYN